MKNISTILTIVLIVLTSACAPKAAPPLPPPPKINFDSLVGPLEVVVPQVHILGGVEGRLYRELCPNGQCGGLTWLPKKPPGELFRNYPDRYDFGIKRFPGLWPDDLGREFARILGGFENITIIDDARRIDSMHKKGPPLLRIHGVITELGWNGEESVMGSGTSIFRVLLLKKDFTVNTLGFARIDVTITDMRNGKILAAFPAAGYFRKEFDAPAADTYQYFVPQGFATALIKSAIQLALYDATNRVAEKLKQLTISRVNAR